MNDLIILGFLASGEAQTSYSLKAIMGQTTNFFQSSSLGSIHPILKTLVQQGYATGNEVMEGKRKKKYYTITQAGREAFETGIRADLGPDKLRLNQLVKIFFFDHLSPEEQMASIDQHIASIEGTLDHIIGIRNAAAIAMGMRETKLSEIPSAQYKFDTLQFGQDYSQFCIDWLNKYKITLAERQG